MWADGSATGGVTDGGAEALIIYPNEDRHELRTPAGSLWSSFRAEMIALRAALDHLPEVPRYLEDPIVVFIDSSSALAALRGETGSATLSAEGRCLEPPPRHHR